MRRRWRIESIIERVGEVGRSESVKVLGRGQNYSTIYTVFKKLESSLIVILFRLNEYFMDS